MEKRQWASSASPPPFGRQRSPPPLYLLPLPAWARFGPATQQQRQPMAPSLSDRWGPVIIFVFPTPTCLHHRPCSGRLGARNDRCTVAGFTMPWGVPSPPLPLLFSLNAHRHQCRHGQQLSALATTACRRHLRRRQLRRQRRPSRLAPRAYEHWKRRGGEEARRWGIGRFASEFFESTSLGLTCALMVC